MAKQKNRGLTASELSAFCAEVALMLGSGMILYDGVEAMANNSKDTPHAAIYARLSENVTKTGSLYEAFKADDCWPDYLAEMVKIGERTGKLEAVMHGLAEYYERESRIRSAIVSAVTYPIILGAMLLLIVLVMIWKVLPVFRRVLGSMGVAMTDSGSMLMRIGVNAGWIVLVLVGVVMLATVVCVLLLRTKMRGCIMDALKKVFPVFRRLSARLSASRVASVLSMMISGGFPLDEALEIVPSVLSDSEAAKRVKGMHQKMDKGASFGDAIVASGLFDDIHSRMILMGIAAGREDQVIEKIAGLYEEQAEEGIANLVAIIEPTLVAVLCIVIGAILLSVMLPMAGIITSIL